MRWDVNGNLLLHRSKGSQHMSKNKVYRIRYTPKCVIWLSGNMMVNPIFRQTHVLRYVHELARTRAHALTTIWIDQIVVDCRLKPGLNSGKGKKRKYRGRELQVLAGFSAFKRFARKQSLIPSNAHPSSMASARPLGELLFDASCQLVYSWRWELLPNISYRSLRFQIWNYKKYMPNTYDYRRTSAGSCCGCMGYNYSSFDRQESDCIRTISI